MLGQSRYCHSFLRARALFTGHRQQPPFVSMSIDGVANGGVVLVVDVDPDKNENEIPTFFGLYNDNQCPDVITRLGYLDAQIKPLHEGYDKLGAAIYTTLSISGVFQAAVFLAINGFAQQIQKSTECEKWSPFILFGIASTVTILVVLCKFLAQFDLCKLGKQLLEQRNFLLEGYLQNESLTIYRGSSLFPEADRTKFRWWSPRAAFLVILIGIATYLCFTCISVLCL